MSGGDAVMPDKNLADSAGHKRKRSGDTEAGDTAGLNDTPGDRTTPPASDHAHSPPSEDVKLTLSRLSAALDTTFTLQGTNLVAPVADLGRISHALDRLAHPPLPPPPPPPRLPPRPPPRSASMSSIAAAAASAARRRSVPPLPLFIPPRSKITNLKGPPSPIAALADAVAARARDHGEYRVATPPHAPKEERDPWEGARKRMRHVERTDWGARDERGQRDDT